MASIFLDSSIFLNYFLNGPKFQKSSRFIVDLDNGQMKAVINTMCILEIKYHILQEKGHEQAEQAIFLIKRNSNLEIVPITSEIAERAAELRSKYYDRNERPLSFADSLHLATAIEKNCSKLVTADSDFKDITEMRTEYIK